MALGINAARNGESHQVHLRSSSEHQCADFDGADAALKIQFACQGHAGELCRRNVRQERTGIEIDRVPPRRPDNRHARSSNVVAQISRGRDAIAQVVFFKRFLQPHGDGLKIAPGKSAVSRVTLGKNQEILLLLREHIVVGTQKAADVGHAIFFRRHRTSVAQQEHLLRNLFRRFVFVSRLTQLDEPRVFSKAAGVEVKRDAVSPANLAHLARIFHRHRLAAA